MPLDSLEAYKRLGEHLSAVDPIIEEFCRETGFARRTVGVSRYPMRRLNLHREVNWFIELRMAENERGERYDAFFPDIPYSLGGGAWIDRDGRRYADASAVTFSRLPFHQLSSQLAVGLRDTWRRIQGFSLDYLLTRGPVELRITT